MAPNPATLAAAVREVNARHAEAGSPHLPELAAAWVALDRALALSTVAGDDKTAQVAIDHYRATALAAIRGAA